jgi:hypothetical protein
MHLATQDAHLLNFLFLKKCCNIFIAHKKIIKLSIAYFSKPHYAFLSFDLMIDLLVTRTIMRSKFANNAFLSVDLLIDVSTS